MPKPPLMLSVPRVGELVQVVDLPRLAEVVEVRHEYEKLIPNGGHTYITVVRVISRTTDPPPRGWRVDPIA